MAPECCLASSFAGGVDCCARCYQCDGCPESRRSDGDRLVSRGKSKLADTPTALCGSEWNELLSALRDPFHSFSLASDSYWRYRVAMGRGIDSDFWHLENHEQSICPRYKHHTAMDFIANTSSLAFRIAIWSSERSFFWTTRARHCINRSATMVQFNTLDGFGRHREASWFRDALAGAVRVCPAALESPWWNSVPPCYPISLCGFSLCLVPISVVVYQPEIMFCGCRTSLC